MVKPRHAFVFREASADLVHAGHWGGGKAAALSNIEPQYLDKVLKLLKK